MFLSGYAIYCFGAKIFLYHPDGGLRCVCRAVRPDTSPENVEEIKKFNEMWKEYHEGCSHYLFPGDRDYPDELPKETGAK